MKKYRVYANYIATKYLGEVEAETKEEAKEKAFNSAECQVSLCWECSNEFMENPMLDDKSIEVEEVE